jgi:hypothetical protein
VPAAEVDFLRWRLGPGSGAACQVAYEGNKLVGTVFSIPHTLRVAGSVVPVSLTTMFTVDPDHRRVALPLIGWLRRHNDQHAIALGVGLILGDPTSVSYRFWSKYAETFPQNFRLLFRGGYVAKFLAADALSRAGVKAWERVASHAFGRLLAAVPYGRDAQVRPYRADDLDRLKQILDESSTHFDWALVWSCEQLTHVFATPMSGTLVFERNGCIRGFIHYRLLWLQGRERLRAALIDLWADDGLSAAQRVRLVAHLCHHLRESGVQLVFGPRCAMLPITAFLANLFLPIPENFYIGVFLARGGTAPTPPRSWSLVLM